MQREQPLPSRLIVTAATLVLVGAACPASRREAPAVASSSLPGGRVGSTISLALTGDVMLGRGIDQVLPHPGDPTIDEVVVNSARQYVALAEARHGPIERPLACSTLWGEPLVALQRRKPDLRIVNLETTVTRSNAAWPEKAVRYRMSPKNVRCLTAARIDCCVLANNHALDWGYAGLAETLETLERAGIRSAGAGRNRAAAEAPAIFELPGKGRVLIFALGSPSSGIPRQWAAGKNRPGVSLLSETATGAAAEIQRRVAAVKGPGDIVVVSVHWGGNWGYRIPRAQRALARRLVESAGVDLVHGHSSHHVKGIEVHRGRLIIYGAGDLINDYEGIGGHQTFRGDLGLIYLATLDAGTGELLRLRLVPTRIHRLRLHLAGTRETRWLATTLDRVGAPLGTRVGIEADSTLNLDWRGKGARQPDRRPR
jgi:poly-gamma-glutamate synthesis protein (capsule biosynthesis protein)